MKTGTVKFSKEFITPIGLKEWASCEMEYDMNSECPKEVLTNAKTIVEQWYKESNIGYPNLLNPDEQHCFTPKTISVERTPEDIRIAELIRDIYACTEIDGDSGLMTYNKLASTCKEAQQAFDIMFRKLAHQKG